MTISGATTIAANSAVTGGGPSAGPYDDQRARLAQSGGAGIFNVRRVRDSSTSLPRKRRRALRPEGHFAADLESGRQSTFYNGETYDPTW